MIYKGKKVRLLSLMKNEALPWVVRFLRASSS